MRKRWDGQYPIALGHQWRRRHLHQSLDGRHLCPVRHHRLGHQDARAMSMRFPASIMCASSSSSTASRTGRSMRRRPRRKPAKARKRFRWRSRDSNNITIANWHAYRVTRTVRPVDTAARIFNSSDIHFRNVHVNAESGLGTCDANGCGTYPAGQQIPRRERHPRPDPSYRCPRAGIRGAGLSGAALPAPAAARHGRQGRKAGRRLLFHLRRGGGCAGQALLRGQAPAAHLWLVARAKAFPSSATIPPIR